MQIMSMKKEVQSDTLLLADVFDKHGKQLLKRLNKN